MRIKKNVYEMIMKRIFEGISFNTMEIKKSGRPPRRAWCGGARKTREPLVTIG